MDFLKSFSFFLNLRLPEVMIVETKTTDGEDVCIKIKLMVNLDHFRKKIFSQNLILIQNVTLI